jgi:hypothetical protein
MNKRQQLASPTINSSKSTNKTGPQLFSDLQNGITRRSQSTSRLHKMTQMISDIDDIKTLVKSAIEKEHQRGDKLDDLNEKATDLIESSAKYNRTSRNLARRYRSKSSCYFYLTMILTLILVLTFIGIGVKLSVQKSWVVNSIGYSFLLLGFISMVFIMGMAFKRYYEQKQSNETDASSDELQSQKRQHKRNAAVSSSHKSAQRRRALKKQEDDSLLSSTISTKVIQKGPIQRRIKRKRRINRYKNNDRHQSSMKPTLFNVSKRTFGEEALRKLNFQMPETGQTDIMLGLETSIKDADDLIELFEALKLAYEELYAKSVFGGRALSYVSDLIEDAKEIYKQQGKVAYKIVFQSQEQKELYRYQMRENSAYF